MKYLQRALLHIGLCLLLVCSANGAFAQDDQVIGLTAPSRNGAMIKFTINLPSIIEFAALANVQIQIDGISISEIGSLSAMVDNRCNFSVAKEQDTPPLIRNLHRL